MLSLPTSASQKFENFLLNVVFSNYDQYHSRLQDFPKKCFNKKGMKFLKLFFL